ncbi:phosphopantetheine-binding protein [Streptomyces sp. NPDC006711]|uniref:phosphopantetheine-binding protein n=1 Tax=unclassified Streptomyces TaxID=2593676 RepID=UPI00369ADE1A
MTTSQIPFTEEALKTIVVEEFEIPADQLTEDATLETLGLDSLGLLELLVAIEAQTHKEISGMDLPISPNTPYHEAARIVTQAVAEAPAVGSGEPVAE